tara:strand:+ start:9506 stop:11107 length:1602 start_codon:yes stop_codon:yes gene_type:complete
MMEFFETPWTQESRPVKTSPKTTSTSRWLGGPVIQAQVNLALEEAGFIPTISVDSGVVQEAVEAGLLPGFNPDGTKIIAPSRDKPAMPTDGKKYVWNEELFDWVEDTTVETGLTLPSADLTPEQQTAWDAWETKFEGIEGMDLLRTEILSGAFDPLKLPDTPFFNNQIRDAGGLVPGGYGGGGNFYNSRSDGLYAETYANEPTQNPISGGQSLWIENADGTGWIENPDYKAPGSVGSESSIAKTTAATDAEAAAEAAKVGAEGATAILTRLAGAFGLPLSVVSKLKKMMVDGLSEEAIALEVRQTPEYAARFPGMKLRQDAGFASMSEADYMANEDSYQELLRTHGLPEKFYDDRMDFATLIAADVSPNEFAERVTLAELATAGADPKTKEELKRLFGIEQTDLVAYYLDPEGATNLIEERRAFEAAGLSATGARVLGQTTGFDKDTAVALQREGIQRREIQQRLSPQTGLVTQLLGEEDEISAADLASGEFGLDPEARNKVRRRREGRVAGFSGQSGMLISGTGATGLGSST